MGNFKPEYAICHVDGAPKEIRHYAYLDAVIEWTVEWRGEPLVRRGVVVGYSRWDEGAHTVGGLLMDCVQVPERKYPDQKFDFTVPVSSHDWRIVER